MAFRVKDAGQALKLAIERGAKPVSGPVGPMELNIPAIEGIGGSNLYLVDRYGAEAIYDVDFRPIAGAPQRVNGARAHRHRPPDPQRAPRPDGSLGRVLRADLQFPRDPHVRHRGPADRPVVAGDDQPGRQDPHPAEREPRRALADRGVPQGLRRRGHPAHRSVDGRYLRHGRGDARGGREVPGHAGVLLRGRRCARCRAMARACSGCAPTASWSTAGRREGQGLLLQIFTENHDRADLLRDHPAQGQRGLRRGQLQGPVRVDRARPDAPRRAAGQGRRQG